ncbi:MoaD/ThiS family protein [Pontibacter sp. JAM-7]|uniref:MoaD/ThiS family protein n=1 Tax=Pontibacter sp. JAM-7 TaxID=3366581 RepID=UPI003AF4C1C1
MLKVVFFASLKERLASEGEVLEKPGHVTTVGELVTFLLQQNSHWVGILDAQNIRTACDHEICDADTPLNGDEEVAFFPPVTGG